MSAPVCDCTFFEEGDWVESRLNSDVFGIIVGQNNFGQFYTVQLAGSMKIETFYAVTLRHMTDFDDDGGDKEPAPTDESKVIDFTRERDLRNAKTKGAA
ncbi:hypothetical protein BTE77_06865 [Ensifer adhaerens]|nr:hypothetical protein BTE77_06865 [Ensifer adhaerens]